MYKDEISDDTTFKNLTARSYVYAIRMLNEDKYLESVEGSYTALEFLIKDMYCTLYEDAEILLENTLELSDLAYKISRKLFKFKMETYLYLENLYFDSRKKKYKVTLDEAKESVNLVHDIIKVCKEDASTETRYREWLFEKYK